MKRKICIGILGLTLLVIKVAAQGQDSKTGRSFLLGCTTDQTTAVRFFYNSGPDYFHFPLVFRVVTAGDRRLGSAPTSPEGRVAYISQEELGRVLRGLAEAQFSWSETKAVKPLGSFKELIGLPPKMQILVMCSGGTASTFIEPKEICSTLAPLDSALSTPRALWEFQLLVATCQDSGWTLTLGATEPPVFPWNHLVSCRRSLGHGLIAERPPRNLPDSASGGLPGPK